MRLILLEDLFFIFLGRIPGRGEVINYKKKLEFTVVEADTRRIKRVLVTAEIMKTKTIFNFLFLGLTLGISQSFIILLPFTILFYYFILLRIYKINSHLIGFLLWLDFWNRFFLGSMHWMVNPFGI